MKRTDQREPRLIPASVGGLQPITMPRLRLGRDHAPCCTLMTPPCENPVARLESHATHVRGLEPRPSVSRWITIPVGIIVGATGAGLIAGILAVIFVLILGRWLGFVMIDTLLVFGLPLLSVPGGAAGGFIVGSLRTWPHAHRLALLVAVVPACAYFVMNAWSRELAHSPRGQFATTAIASLCMISASAIGIGTAARMIRAIERHAIARRTTAS